MTSTNRILCAVLLLGFTACGSGNSSGSGGAGGGTGGTGGAAMGGNGGSGHSGGAGGHPSASGGVGGGGGKGMGGAAGAGTGGGAAGAGGGTAGIGGGTAGVGGGTAGAGGGTAGTGGNAGGNGGGGKGGDSGGGGAGGVPGPCAFSATYTINDGGGIAAFVKRTTLTPPAMFRYEYRTDVNGPMQSCAPALPVCGSATKVDVSDIEAAMANADVQAAFATTDEPFYGRRDVADGPSFEVVRSTGGKFFVGLECTVASTSCTTTPAGVHVLVQLLQQLITQQTADPSCALH